MTISLETSRINYTGNGSTSVYSFPFKIFKDADLLVTSRNTSNVETTLVLTTDYTVSGAGSDSGGSVTLLAGNLTSGYALTIRRVVDVTQTTDIRNQGSFYPETHEDEFDYLTMIDQQQQDSIDRSIKIAETDTTTGLTLPDAATRASKYFAFDGDGNAIAASSVDVSNATVSSYMLTLLDDSNAAVARATLGFSGASGTVAAANLASDSVITAKILDANVTRAKLAAGAVGRSSVTATKTTSYTAVSTTDDFIPCDASSGGFTVTLPAVSGNTGKRFIFQKVDSSVNVVTIDGNASETINGALTAALATQYEIIEIYCTGSVWLILSRDYPRTTLSTIAYTYSGVGTVVTPENFSTRIGDRLFVTGRAVCGTVAASAFSINISAYLIDNTKVTTSSQKQLVGHLYRLTAASTAIPQTSTGAYPLFFDGSNLQNIFCANDVGTSTKIFTKSNGNSLFSNSDGFTYSFNIPISGWE